MMGDSKSTTDAIVVLAGGIEPNGTLSSITRDRVEAGAALYHRGLAPHLIMSGRWGLLSDFTPPRTEANAMKRLAVELGVPRRAILIEDRSKDTIGNAYFVRTRILDPRRWRSIVVVTSDYHRARTVYFFRKVLGPQFRFRIVTVSHRLPASWLRRTRAQESALRLLGHRSLDHIPDGNLPQITRWLAIHHPAYSPHPERAKKLLLELMKSSPRLWHTLRTRWRSLTE